MNALQLTKETFDKEVLEAKQTVLVDFWAQWCGPCRMLLPIVEELAAELTDVKVCKVNVDEQEELAARFKVMTIPTLLVFKKGEIVKTSIGAKSKKEIMDMLY